jgi:hypothetical protein
MSDAQPPIPPAPGAPILSEFSDRLTRLGFELSAEHDAVTNQSVVDVTLGGRPLCRIEFGDFGGRYSLNVLPVDRTQINLLANAGGRINDPEPAYLAEELDHVEALFRSALVRAGRMEIDEFPTDYALKRWVTSAASVRLPHERAARRRHIDDVVIRPGELPDDRHRSSTPASKAIVQAARLLDVSFERGRAIDIARAAASMTLDRDAASDKAASYLTIGARIVMRGRRRDMDLAWDKGSYDRALILHPGERDDLRVPLSLTEEAPAPRMW